MGGRADNTSARSWAGGNKTHAKALVNPEFRGSWSVALRQTEWQANCLQFGPTQIPACPYQSLWLIDVRVSDGSELSMFMTASGSSCSHSPAFQFNSAYLSGISHFALTTYSPLFTQWVCLLWRGFKQTKGIIPRSDYTGGELLMQHVVKEKRRKKLLFTSVRAGLYSSVSLQFWTPPGSSRLAGSRWQFPTPHQEEEYTSEMILPAILTIPVLTIIKNSGSTPNRQQQRWETAGAGGTT